MESKKPRKKRNNHLIPLSSIDTILKRTGASCVSQDARNQLSESLEEIAGQIAVKAFKFASHSKRKTIQRKDILEALKI